MGLFDFLNQFGQAALDAAAQSQAQQRPNAPRPASPRGGSFMRPVVPNTKPACCSVKR